ncbi:MAG TPA: DUF3108 domain-containing protein [Afipia sp.]
MFRTFALRRAFGLAALGLAAAVLFCDPLAAQGRVEAKYEVTLGGITIGKGNWVVTIGDDEFSSVVVGGTSGIMKAIGNGSGNATVQGRVAAGQLNPVIYQTSINYGPKNETIRIALANGNIKDSSIEPPPPFNPERVLVTEAHRHGVLDPLTGSLLRVSGNGDPVSPEACRNTASVFDGRMRYDLRLEYKRMEMMKFANGYQGPVVVCGVYFTPLSGYIPGRYAIKYLAEQRDMEIAFAPIAGTRVLAPVRMKIPTPIGTGIVEASEFTTATIARTAKTN